MSPLLKKRPNVFVALLLLLVAAALFAPYLLQPDSLMWPRSGLGTDLLTYNWTSAQFFRDAVRETGQFPLWQGTFMGGQPMIGNPAIRVFYPPQLVMTLLPIPLLWGYALLNVFHFWLAGMGGYGLARSVLKLDYPAAVLAGLLVLLTPRLSSNVVGDVGYTYGLCWVPVCLLWMRLALDRLSWRWAIACGIALCGIYLTNIQFILYMGFLVGLYFLYCCVALLIRRAVFKQWLRTAGVMLVIVASFAGFSAFQAFPFASYLPYQSRQAMTLTDANYLALPLVGLMHTVFPIAQKFPEWESYVGLLPLVFAPLAVSFLSKRDKVWWFGLLIFAVLFSLGTATPLYSVMFYGVPGFSLLRVPARMWYVAALVLILLAAIGMNGLLSGKQVPRWAWRWIGMSAPLLMIFTIGGRFITRQNDQADWLLGFAAGGGLILCLLGIWLWRQGRLKPGGVIWLMVVAVMVDLFPLDQAFAEARPLADFTRSPPIVEHILSQSSDDHLYRLYSTRREVSDAVAVAHDLQAVEGLNSFQFAAYARFMRVASGCDLPGLAAAIPACISNEISDTAWLDARPNPILLGLLNVRYVISSLDLAGNPQLRLIASVGDSHLYENAAVQPRAFVVGRAEIVEGDFSTALSQLGQRPVALFDTAQTLPSVLPDHNYIFAASMVRYAPNEVIVQADLPDDGVLVLADSWVPGWSAYVDRQTVPLLRVNGALRGVVLSAGSHTVRFEFMPPAFVVGLVMTIVTILIVVGLLLFSRINESSQVMSS